MKKRVLLGCCVSIVLYLFVSFGEWDLLWFRVIPLLTVEQRVLNLVFYCFVQLFSQLVLSFCRLYK
jgi:hypothetical protein